MKISRAAAQHGPGRDPVAGLRACSAQELIVSAAASLTNAFQAAGKAFEQAQPGAKSRSTSRASGPLLPQIAQGAPVDVFASADQETMNRAASAHLIAPATRVDFAANTLVLDRARGIDRRLAEQLSDLANAVVPAHRDRHAGDCSGRALHQGGDRQGAASRRRSNRAGSSARACARSSTTWRAARSMPASSTHRRAIDARARSRSR